MPVAGLPGVDTTHVDDAPGRLRTVAAQTVEVQLSQLATGVTQTAQPAITSRSNALTLEPAPVVTPMQGTVEQGKSADAFEPPLKAGGQARVLIVPVTVRSAPGLSSAQISFLTRDRSGLAVSRPRCEAGLW